MASQAPGLRRGWLAAVAAAMTFVATAVAGGCAQGTVTQLGDGGSTTTASTSVGTGGAGAQPGNGGMGGDPFPCGIDCSSITTPDCSKAECDMATLNCVVVPEVNGTSCDDGLFCTVNDACVDGECTGGPDNDCGLTPDACQAVSCDELNKTCGLSSVPNGDPCVDPNNLCVVNAACTNGLCLGTVKDCFFSPVPDDCHVAVCNPISGICEPIVGNEGLDCTDLNDLCTVNKTCLSGVCQAGNPKDCSAQTVGCNNGVCNTTTGQCEQQPVPAGGACAQGDSDCTLGICDMNGTCIATPANEAGVCNDLNACTSGETCSAGACGSGSPVTQCVNGDGCCPAACTENNDDDCGCSINLATSATGSSNGGGVNALGPPAWNNGAAQMGCLNNFGWISNDTNPNGAFMQYTWPAPVQIGSIYLDANLCSECNGRTLDSAEVQWWDGAQWQTATTVTGNNGDLALTFSPKLNTTQLRLFNVTAGAGCGQASNTLVYEWWVWTGSNCTPPP